MHASPSSIHIRRAVEPTETISADEAIRRARAAHARLHPPAKPLQFRRAVEAPEPAPEPVTPISNAAFTEVSGMTATVRFMGFNAAESLEPPRIRVRDIIAAAAAHFGITPNDIHSQRRDTLITRPRMAVMYLAKELTTSSLVVIGQQIGGRDHTTILSGIRRIEKLMAEGDDELAKAVQAIRVMLGVAK